MISLEDFPILILEVILKYVDLNDKKNLRLTCSTLSFRIISIDGLMRAWTVKLTPSSLLQTKSILSNAMTKIKDYNWNVALNINIINLNIFHEEVIEILSDWQEYIQALDVKLIELDSDLNSLIPVHLPMLGALTITGLSHTTSLLAKRLITNYAKTIKFLKVVGDQGMRNYEIDLEETITQSQLDSLILQNCRIQALILNFRNTITSLELFNVEYSGLEQSDFSLPNLTHLVIHSGRFQDLNYNFLIANALNLTLLGLLCDVRSVNFDSDFKLENLKALIVKSSDYLYFHQYCYNLETLVVIKGFFDPDTYVKFPKLKNIILCDSLTYISTNSYKIVEDNCESLQFLAILCTRISPRDFSFDLPNLKLFLVESCNHDEVYFLKTRYPHAEVSNINWKYCRKMSQLCQKFPAISRIIQSVSNQQ